MSRDGSRCPYDDPDCENCPFPDCKATILDIKRQSAYSKKKFLEERNLEILKMWNNGVNMSDIGKSYGLERSTIKHVLKLQMKKGMEVRPVP